MTDPDDIAKLIPLAEGLWARQAVDNIVWMDLGDGGLVVDALEQPELEDEVFGAIASTLGERTVRHVLNTHTHYDHVALNQAFVRRCGAKIVNQDATPLPPDGRWFQGPRRRVHMIPMPGCHTDEDCVVWVEPDRVLCVGDIFGWGLIPLTVNLRADTEKLLLDTYGRLIAMDAAVVVPGHGPLCATADLKRWVDYYQWLKAQVHQACQAGWSDDEILRRVEPPSDMRTWWRFVAWKHQDSLTKMIKPVRKGWVQPT